MSFVRARRRSRGIRVWCLVACALLGLPSIAAATERILRFDSRIEVHQNGSMIVDETIEVEAEGQEIKRGIYRDFPTRYRDRDGNRYSVDFEVLAVERDGRPEPYFTERRGNGERVYIGDKDVFLQPGRYVYRLSYRTDRQLGFFETYDELYWNVTGNDWAFAIERAGATVTLPEGIPPESLRLFGYTGPSGASGTAYRSAMNAAGEPTLRTTAPLAPGEGFTISVAWAPGFVARPTGADRIRYALRDRLSLVVGVSGFVLLLIYYATIWLRVGRDPDQGVIIPRFEPPKGLSPAAIRYIDRMGFDQRAFAAAVIDMAVKGYLTIEDEDREFTLRRREGQDAATLSVGERKLAGHLFQGGNSIRLHQTNHKTISKAVNSLKRLFDVEYHRVYFYKNSGYLVPGVLLAIVTVVLVGLFGDGGAGPISIFMVVWLSIWSISVYFLWAQRQILMAIIFSGAELMAIILFLNFLSVWQIALLLGLIGVNAAFYFLLKAPTRLGRTIMDEIDGLKEYLAIAEEDRLHALHPPERTPELFERFLPYALALGVEQKWSEKFAGILAAAASQPEGYRPGWYSGSRFRTNSMGQFSQSLGSSLASAVASSSTAPGSSSGSGGGGSSGGGGGGGGGGGW